MRYHGIQLGIAGIKKHQSNGLSNGQIEEIRMARWLGAIEILRLKVNCNMCYQPLWSWLITGERPNAHGVCGMEQLWAEHGHRNAIGRWFILILNVGVVWCNSSHSPWERIMVCTRQEAKQRLKNKCCLCAFVGQWSIIGGHIIPYLG